MSIGYCRRQEVTLGNFDVTSAFTQAPIDDVHVFVEPPKGFEEWEVIDGKRVSKLLYLKQALYGTKQASRLWQDTLREFLESPELGFKRSPHEPCLYRLEKSGSELLVGVYVDDVVVAHRGDKLFEEFKSKFLSRFRAKHIGPLQWFLGMEVDQHDDFSVHVSQKAFIQKVADKFIAHNVVSRTHPPNDLFNSLDRAASDVERAQVTDFQYKSIIGALLYASVMTRPDVSYHTSILAKFMADPSPDCCKAAIQLLQYLETTKHNRCHSLDMFLFLLDWRSMVRTFRTIMASLHIRIVHGETNIHIQCSDIVSICLEVW